MPVIPNNFMSGASHVVPGTGEPWIGAIIEALTGLTLADAKAYPAASRLESMDGQLFWIDGVPWQYSHTSALTGDDVLVAEFDEGGGRLLRMPGLCVLEFPITFETADAATLYALPDGAYFMPVEFMWANITAPFTGGAASAIGVSSTKVGYTTKGDLLGGAAGDVEATLVAADFTLGTIGAAWATIANRRAVWEPGEDFRFDRIVDAFATGEGSVKVVGYLLANAGA